MSRGVLLAKEGAHPDSAPAYRPIGINSCISRFVSRVASMAVAKQVGAKLTPFQVGVGIPSGCEIAAGLLSAHLLSNSYAPHGKAVLVLDAVNAFNTIHRQAIFEGLVTYCPELVRFFRWKYGQPSEIRGTDGSIIGYSESGCSQGDPLAMLYFCTGFQKVLIGLNARLSAAEELVRQDNPYRAQHNPVEPGFTSGYADDGALAGEPEVLLIVTKHVDQEYAEVGLKVNHRKSAMLCQQPHLDETLADIPSDLRITGTGLRILGVQIGTGAFVAGALTEAALKRPIPSRALTHLGNKQTALQLLSKCCIARFNFTRGSYHPTIAREVYTAGDKEVDKIVAHIAEMPCDDRKLTVLRGIPAAHGGLGMPHLIGPVTEFRWATVRLIISQFVQAHPDLHPLRRTLLGEAILQPVDIGTMNVTGVDLTHCTDKVPHPTVNITLDKAKAIYRKAVTQVYRQMFADTILAAFHAGEGDNSSAQAGTQSAIDRTCAAHLLHCQHPNSNKFLGAKTGPGQCGNQFTSETFGYAVKGRLAGPIDAPPPRGPSLVCRCRSRHPAIYQALHCLSCQDPLQLTTRTLRHHAAVRNLVAFIKRVSPGSTVAVEVEVTPAIRLDIGITPPGGGTTTYIDVHIINAAQQSVINMQQEDWQFDPDAVTRAGEDAKRSKYAEYLSPAANALFVPFVIDATAYLGKAARNFLEKLMPKDPLTGKQHPDDKYARTALLHEISTTIAVHHGKMVGVARAILLPVLQG
jgi:hypothetical protein